MIPHSWLKERIEVTSLHEVVRRDLNQLGLSNPNGQELLAPGPSPAWAQKWQTFISRMIAGDELWSFKSPPETWNNLAGVAGYAIVRSNNIVATITSSRS
jgi:hypothetical protein